MRIQSLWLPALLLASCAIKPIDPWRRGAWALERHDLDAALAAFAEVPLQHVRYPESRTAAHAVRRTMRHCDELLCDALQLRSEGRDAEALAVLRRTQALWAGAPGVDGLIAATELRQRLAPPTVSGLRREPAQLATAAAPMAVPTRPAAEQPPRPVALTAPAAEPTPVPPAAEVAVVDEAVAPEPELVVVTQPAAEPERLVTPPRNAPEPVAESRAEALAVVSVGQQAAIGGDAVTAALVAAETRLVRGDRQAAIDELLALAQQHPQDLRVRVRVSRLLHQRALVRYGDGALDGAVADWRRVLELDPAHATAATLLRAAERESAAISGSLR